jgi:hypothetical protein
MTLCSKVLDCRVPDFSSNGSLEKGARNVECSGLLNVSDYLETFSHIWHTIELEHVPIV